MLIVTDTWWHMWDNESPLGVSGCLLSQLHPPSQKTPPQRTCKLPFFHDIVLIFGFFNSPTFSSNNVWSLTWEKSQKQHQGNGETWVGARLKWRGKKAGKTVGQRAIVKRWGQESQRETVNVREREKRMDGWTEREWGGWREEGFNPAWIMEQTGAGGGGGGGRDRKSVYPFIHAFPSLFAPRPSRSGSSEEESMRLASRSGTEHT